MAVSKRLGILKVELLASYSEILAFPVPKKHCLTLPEKKIAAMAKSLSYKH